MRHRVAGRKLSRPTGHRIAMYRNLVTDLLRYGKIVTTEAKAKEVRGMAEKIITLGKDGSLPARRRALSFVNDKKVVAKLFDELGPRFKSRVSGFTRIVRLGKRRGDDAMLVKMELVEKAKVEEKKVKEKKEKGFNMQEIRKQYPRAYTKWTDNEDTLLRDKYQTNRNIEELAAEFQRQPSAIRSRLRKLGLH